MPLRFQEVTPRDLGVHPSRFGIEGDSPMSAVMLMTCWLMRLPATRSN